MSTQTHMTHVDFTDVYATVPGSDDGIGAWQPLTQEQRDGWACIDCGKGFYGAEQPPRPIGRCEDCEVQVCQSCYEQRLRDHIDYYRPRS